MTKEEWLKRYKAQFMKEAGITDDQAEECASADTFEKLSEGFEEDPEGAADEEMSYWGGDGE